jgi:hypothetical protein
LPKQREVDLQPRKEHQQQHAEFGEELGDRVLAGEDIEHVWPEQHAAQQQPYRLRKADAARKSRDAGDQRQEHRSARQDRQKRDSAMHGFKD